MTFQDFFGGAGVSFSSDIPGVCRFPANIEKR